MDAMQAEKKNKNTYLKTNVDAAAIESKQTADAVKSKH